MCKLLNVERASYYEWLTAQPSLRFQKNQELTAAIKALFFGSRCTYGTGRIRTALLQSGLSISRRRVGKIMKKEQLSCKTKRKFKNTTDSNHKQAIAPNLLDRDFIALAPNEKYVGDITYIHTQEGWLYLAVVIDLCSRQIISRH